MQKKPYISMPVIRRLPRYYRFLRHLDKRGVTRISSKELSEKMGFTASQVRQDFNCFGGYGQQGYGYGVHQLCEEIGSILGVDRAHKCILIGAGNLGKAIATHISYNFAGFDLIGIFDNSEQVVGQQIADLRVLPAAGIRRFCSENAPLMAILCVPDSAVKSVVELLYDIGIKSYWNFSHYDITMKHPDAIVEKLAKASERALNSPAMKKSAEENYEILAWLPPSEADAFLQSEFDFYRDLSMSMGLHYTQRPKK